MDKVERLIKKCSFFGKLGQEHLAKIAKGAKLVSFKAGDLVFSEGQKADGFYILESGSVNVELYSPAHGDLRIQTLGAGDMLGWSWLVPPHRWRFGARVLVPSRAILLDGKRLRGLAKRDRSLGYELLSRICKVISIRLEAASLQLLDLYGLR